MLSARTGALQRFLRLLGRRDSHDPAATDQIRRRPTSEHAREPHAARQLRPLVSLSAPKEADR